MSPNRLARVLFAVGLLALAACATQKHSRDLLQVTLYDYAGAIRWGNIPGAASFLDPEVVAKKPVSSVDMQRYDHVRFTSYSVIGTEQPTPGDVYQVVEIRLTNNHTQVERSITDRQHWRYDEEQRRWWLTTGLPNITETR
jgi:hypothetical protein